MVTEAAAPAYARELATAIDAVRRATRLTRAVAADLGNDDRAVKGDRSPVTVADHGSQALISLALAAAFPDDPIVGEEDADDLRGPSGAALAERIARRVAAVDHDAGRDAVLDAIDRCRHRGGPSGRFWTLDPVDGTKGFLHGEQYAVALALVEDGEVVLGVLGCPNLPARSGHRGALYAALRGRGAWELPLDVVDDPRRRKRLAVDAVGDPAEATLCESVDAGHSDQGGAARVAALLGITRGPVRLDSQCKYALVARGGATIYLRLPTSAAYRERIWDHAAGCLLVTEAGGRVTDVRGARLDFAAGRTLDRNAGIVATNGAVHDAVLRAVSEALEG